MTILRVPAFTYQQFDADFSLEIPAEGYGGWKRLEIDLCCEHTAVVVMHAWDFGTLERYPGWHRAVEYIPRANKIMRDVFPKLLETTRGGGINLLHVVGGGDYYKDLPGYLKTVELAGPSPAGLEQIDDDPFLKELKALKGRECFVGSHNEQDVRNGFAELNFPAEARPLDDEPIAENGHQLFAVCKSLGVNHLIYAGFAINWCLLLSPGGMADMSARGFLCSVFRQAVTAVENRETAREEMCKEIALWRVALSFGFVLDSDDFIAGVLGNGRFPASCSRPRRPA